MKDVNRTTNRVRLKDRFIEDMKVKKYADSTISLYVSEVERFFKRQCPDKTPARVTESDFRNYLVYLATERNYSGSALKIAYSGMKFFFCTTMNRDWHSFGMLRNIKVAKKIPLVLERTDILKILSNINSAHAYVLFYTIYSCGLRISECRNLRVSNIHRKRMVLRIIGKGNKEREIPLPKYTLELITKYYKMHRNPEFIFPSLGHSGLKGPISKTSISTSALYLIWQANLKELGMGNRGITAHTLRHSYATHLLEAGVNVRQVQQYLGHGTLNTTVVYLHLTKGGQVGAKKIINELMGKEVKDV